MEPQGVDTGLSGDEDKAARGLVVASQEYASVKARNLAFMDPVRWATMGKIAQTFVQAGAMPAGMNAAKAMMALQAGYEAGIAPIEAINSFYFVNGKIAMYGETVIRQVIRAGHRVEWGDCDATRANVTITRGDSGKSMSATFTIEQARDRGFLSKDTWKKYPENMLKFRAFSMVAKFIAPDALMGIQIGEELEGEVIAPDGTRTPVKAAAAPAAQQTGHKPLADVLAEPDAQEESGSTEPNKDDKKPRSKKSEDKKPENGRLV